MAMETTLPRTSLTLLVGDDNPADVYFIRRVLEAHGFTYTLEVMENRQGVLHFFDQLALPVHTRCPDLLLLDLYLPGVNTGALVQWIKAMPPCAALRMVIITGSSDPAARTEALALGADAFFVKPLSFHVYMELGDLITALVAGDAQGSARDASGHSRTQHA